MRSLRGRLLAGVLCLGMMFYAPPGIEFLGAQFLGVRTAHAWTGSDCTAEWNALQAAIMKEALAKAAWEEAKKELKKAWEAYDAAVVALELAEAALSAAETELAIAQKNHKAAIVAFGVASGAVAALMILIGIALVSPDPASKAALPPLYGELALATLVLWGAEKALSAAQGSLALAQAAHAAAKATRDAAKNDVDWAGIVVCGWEIVEENREAEYRSAKGERSAAQQEFDECMGYGGW